MLWLHDERPDKRELPLDDCEVLLDECELLLDECELLFNECELLLYECELLLDDEGVGLRGEFAGRDPHELGRCVESRYSDDERSACLVTTCGVKG